MPASPPPPLPRWRKATKIAVLLGPADGSKPAITDRVDYLRPINATVGFGGQQLDSVSLSFDLKRANQRLQDTSLPQGHNRTVELRVENPITGKLDRLLAWGKLARQPQRIGDRETVDFLGRLDHFLFGIRLRGYPVRDPNSGDVVLIRKPIVFNPVIDDTRFPNRSDLLFGGITGAATSRLFVDPESLRTKTARQIQAAKATRWDLATAVERLCWTLNADEDWITNPLLADLQSVLGVDTPLLENHKVELDATLPEALDQLLAPHGFTWFVEHSIDITDLALPPTSTIRVSERGRGEEITLRLQRLEDLIDSSLTNIDSLNISYDIAARPNVIEGYTSLARREGTFLLRPCWPKSSDTLTKAELTEELKEHDREHIDVFRKFVLDTAGDYAGLRDDFGTVVDLEELFGSATVPIRRRFWPALTRGLDRQLLGVNGYLLEWHNGTEWITVPWSFSVLESECGILLERGIDEAFRSEFLKKTRGVAAGDVPDPILRITCCIEGDAPTTYRAERRDESANGVDIVQRYNLSHKFHDARVLEDGAFASVIYYDRHDSITATTAPGLLGGTVEVSVDLTEILKEGDRVNILGSTANDGVYHVASLVYAAPFTTITLREPLADDTADGVLAYLTDEEQPLTKLTRYCDDIQEQEDFVVIHADATLFGLDQPEYTLGKVVTKVEQRNLSLDSYADAAVEQRHPQITRISYTFDGRQSIALTLDQFDRVAEKSRARLLKR